jgi:hypothetical protein
VVLWIAQPPHRENTFPGCGDFDARLPIQGLEFFHGDYPVITFSICAYR